VEVSDLISERVCECLCGLMGDSMEGIGIIINGL
jgi:hypothetical protein